MPHPFTKLAYCVYVLHSVADDHLYVGFLTGLKQRLTDHFQGRVKATALRLMLRNSLAAAESFTPHD